MGDGRQSSSRSNKWTVMRRPWPFLLVGLVALGVPALPARHLQLGYADYHVLPTSNAVREVNDDLASELGPGVGDPVTLVPRDRPAGPSAMAALPVYATRLWQLQAWPSSTPRPAPTSTGPRGR